MNTLKKLLAVLIAMLVANPYCCCASEHSAKAESACCAKKHQAADEKVPSPNDRPCDSCSAKMPKVADGGPAVLKASYPPVVFLPVAPGELTVLPRVVNFAGRAHPATAPPPRSARLRLVMWQSFLI